MNRSKLLLVCEYATLNGGEHSLLAALPTIRASGFEIYFAGPDAGPLAERLRASSVQQVPFLLHDSAGNRLPLVETRQRLSELIDEIRPDLLHANSLSMGRLAGPVAQEKHLPSLSHLRDIINVSAAVVADLNCHRQLLAVSHATRKHHVAGGLDPSKTTVLYNGADLQQFQPAPPTGYLQRELKLPDHARLLATIGQIGLRKDPATFLQAAAAVAQRLPDIHFLLIGERNSTKQESRDLESTLHLLASRAPLAGRVHFLGVRDDIAQLLPELTLLIHTALQEPLGRVLLEGAACGVPIIASRVGGTEEIFPAADQAARLFPAGDSDALAKAILELMGDSVARASLGLRARRCAEERFDIRQRALQLVEIYRSLISSAG